MGGSGMLILLVRYVEFVNVLYMSGSVLGVIV